MLRLSHVAEHLVIGVFVTAIIQIYYKYIISLMCLMLEIIDKELYCITGCICEYHKPFSYFARYLNCDVLWGLSSLNFVTTLPQLLGFDTMNVQ